MLDQPAPILGNKSPRAAAKTAKGRAKVTDWLKMLENSAAKFTGRNNDMASYNFAWLWAELHGITPLGFLLSLMRDANNDPALRLRDAGLVGPYLHPKGEPNEAPGEMRVVDDPYGFGADIGDTHKSIEQAQERLRSLRPTISTGWQDFEEYFAADEKAQQTPAYLELEKIIAEKQAALKCPPQLQRTRQQAGSGPA
jgi:hypothetical protein